jgi:hypothetical protein
MSMHRSSKYFLLFLLIVVLFAAYLVINRKQLTTNTASGPASQQVLSTEDQNAQCHAQFLNASDPQAVMPDPNCTPGSINPDVTQDTIDQTICKRGFTKTIRPPVSYTNRLKREQIQEYGFLDTNMHDFEEDHMISLELGGSPDDPRNLWPEPHGSPNEKDLVENYLNQQICDHQMTLEEAQKEISTDWYTVYNTISQQ